MFRKSSCSTLLALVLPLVIAGTVAAAEPPLIPDLVAERHGLQRSWFAQADIDRGRSRLIDMKLYEGILYLISDSARVQAVDAETGATLWSKQIGKAEYPSLPLGVGGDMVAVVNGSRLFVANRYNGAVIFEHSVDGAPGGGPAVNDRRVYIPMTTGMIAAYRVRLEFDVNKDRWDRRSELSSEEQNQLETLRRQKIRVDLRPVQPLFFKSRGLTRVQPLVMRESNDEEYTSWPTDQGYLYIARINRHSDHYIDIRARIKANAPITMQPAYLPPSPEINPDFGVLFFGSNDGFVTAIREDGVLVWQFPTGEAIVEPPVSIGDRVYFSTEHGGLYCVAAKPEAAGRAVQHWYAPGALKFLAANKTHVYAADRSGNTLILDAASGVRVDALKTQKLTLKLMNSETDRLYMATPDGLLQCLHEIGVKEPLRYDLERKQAANSAKQAPEKKGPAKVGENPFEKAEKAPAEKPEESAEKTEEPAAEEKPAIEEEKPTEEEKPVVEEEKPAEEKPAEGEEKPAEEKPAPEGDNPFGG